MDKKEILKRVKSKNKDEREKLVETKSYQFSWFSVNLMITLLVLIRINNQEPIGDLLMLVWTQVTAGSFYQFWKVQTISALITGLMSLGLLMYFGYQVLVQYGLL